MTITLSTPTETGAKRPYIKLQNVGDSVVIAVAHINKKVQQNDYDTGAPLVWYNRKPTPDLAVPPGELLGCQPVYGTGITGIITAVNGTAIGRQGGEDIQLEPGLEVSIYCDGGKNSDQGRYVEAERAHGPVNLADILRYRFDRTEPASNPRYNDRKIMDFDYRKPKTEELDQHLAVCEQIWEGFQETPTLSTPSSHDDTPSEPVYDEDPF